MTNDARDPAPEYRIVRDVCWLGEDGPEFRDDYPLSFPPDADDAEETPEPGLPASLKSGNGAD